jgi:hypothetical protein
MLRDSGAINTDITRYTIYQGVAHQTWTIAYAETDFFPFIQRVNKKNIYLEGPSTVCCGQSTQLAFSPGFYNYQWFKDGVAIPGATRNKLGNITQGGVYSVRYNRRGKATNYFSNTITITGNQTLTVSLTSPSNNASFTSPASIALAATASDISGTVTKVDFYNGATLLGTDATSPYQFTWTGVAAGTYNLTAKATNNLNSVTSSGIVSVIVTAPVNLSPSVSISSPANNASFTAPASISLAATATDADGLVSKVDFYSTSGAVTTLLGTDASSPYQFSWTGVTAGTYSLTAKATDNLGAVTTSAAVSVTVTGASNVSPSVGISSPANNASFTAPASISLAATATDADGTVSKVDFYSTSGAVTTLLGTDASSPYQFSWTGMAAGTYSLTAKATDNLGAVTTSAAVSVTVAASGNKLPVVTITSPVNNVSYLAPKSFEIDATATDADGSIANVDFYLGSTLVGSDNYPPYAVTAWNVGIGTYTLTVKATDNLGGVGSGSILVNLTDASAYLSTSASCFTAGGGVNFTLATAQRANASNYWWSYSGQGLSFSYSGGAAGYLANATASSSITSGDVCVGVTYTDGGYAQYCKVMNKCVAAREDDFATEETTILSNNGTDGKLSLFSPKDISTLHVISVTGSLVYSERDIPAGQRIELVASIPNGLNIVQITFVDGRNEIHKIHKTQ